MNHHESHPNSKKVAINFKKAQTHLSRIKKMLDEKAYCIDIMQQNLAVIGLLKSAHQMLMEDHLHSCFESAMKADDEVTKARMTEEILTVTKLLNK